MRILFSVVTVTYHNMVFQIVTNDENAIDRISQSRLARNIWSVLKPHHKLHKKHSVWTGYNLRLH